MKANTRKAVRFATGFGLLVVVCWLILPVGYKASLYRAIPVGGSYYMFNRLASLLKLGMSAEEVHAILGEPDVREVLAGGERWNYWETGPTAGGIRLADFSTNESGGQLVFFLNLQHIVFTNSPYFEMGHPIDAGRFESDATLRARHEQWQRNHGRPKP